MTRVPMLQPARTLLLTGYYHGHLYYRGVIDQVYGPLAKGAYWLNQNVIDGVVNGAGRATTTYLSRGTYWVDQRVVDNVYNGSAVGTSEAGGVLRYIQTGRVQQYAAVLFLAVAVGAFVLVVAV